MIPIYEPKTRAKEYCHLAINIYTGCNHGCTYCYAKKFHDRYHPKEDFANVQTRPGIVEATKKQLSTGNYKGKIIQLCFTCDPYPAKIDTTPTREIIKVIKEAGANVQILTKGGDRAIRDFDLLDSGDAFGITLTCLSRIASREEPGAAKPTDRVNSLLDAARLGIKTWISFEPVLNVVEVLRMIETIPSLLEKNKPLLKIGKLNHVANSTDWKAFGLEAERICKENGWNYYIKEDLRNEMLKEVTP